MKKFLLCLWLLSFSLTAGAGELIISSGTSSNLATVWGEVGNRSGDYSLRYAGDRFGIRADKSVHGDDAGNLTITGDVLAHPFGGLVFGAGLAYSKDRLRQEGEHENFHATAGIEFPRLIGHAGAGVWFDHWSNGRRLFNRHDVLGNPPRNVLSVGLSFAL